MIIYKILVLSPFLILSTYYNSLAQDIEEEYYSITVPEITHKDLFEIVNEDKNILYLVNFWATWCIPCVKKLPTLLEINNQYRNNPNFKLYLISLDFARNKKSVVIPFLEKYNINAEVFILNDVKRMNTWIPLVHSSWSGAIPAMAIFKNGKSLYFKEGIIQEWKLKNIIKQNL